MADVNAKLSIVAELVDNVSKSAKSISGNLEKMGKTAGIAGAAILAGVGATVYAAAQAQKEMAVADKTLQNFAKSANLSDKEFSALQKSMQQAGDAAVKLGFDDEEASKSFAYFVSTTKDATLAMKANQAAMDLASAKGIGLEQATKMVNMALQGSPKLLREYGIALEDGASQTEVLSALTEKFGGTASEVAGTFAGQMAVFQTTFGNLMEQIGTALLPILTQVMEAITPVVQAIINWAQAHPELTKWIVIAVTVLGALLAAFGAIVTIAPVVGAAITILTGPVGIVIAIIGLLIAIGVMLWKNWDQIKENLTIIFGAIAQAFALTWKQIQDAFSAAWASLVNTLKTVGAAFLSAIGAVANAMVTPFVSAWEKIKSTFISAFNWLIDKVNKLISSLNRVLSTAGDLVGISVSIPKIPKLATGGPAMANRPHIVGERGPELFVPRSNGYVVPNGALAGMGGVTVQIYGGTYLSQDVAVDIGDLIVERQKKVAKLSI